MGANKKVYELKSLDFLNARIDEIYLIDDYDNFAETSRSKDLLYLKGIMAATFMRFERMCRYTYNSDINLSLKKLNKKLFSEQFKFLYDNLSERKFNIYLADGSCQEVNGITCLTCMLSKLRNINLHAVVFGKPDLIFRIDSEFMSIFPKLANNVHYIKDGILTIAGMFIISYSIMRDEQLKKAMSNFNNIWGNVVWGNKKDFDSILNKLLSEFNTDYSVKIRKVNTETDLIKCIFGRLQKSVEVNSDNGVTTFSLDISQDLKSPWFGVKGSIDSSKNILVIKKGSNFGRYFFEDYVLTIHNRDKFSEFCRSAPPFMAVAYLYHNNVHDFYGFGDEDKIKLEKLNQPKFYQDKDMVILCSGKKFADMREINKSLTEGLIKFILNFEIRAVPAIAVDTSSKYLKFFDILNKLNFPEELINKMVAIRNFSSHYGILNNFHCINSDEGYYMTLSFVINTLGEFYKYLSADKVMSKEAEKVCADINNFVINNLIGVKYKRIYEQSVSLFVSQSDGKTKDKIAEQLEKSLLTAENSVISAEDECLLSDMANNQFYFKYNKPLLPLRGSSAPDRLQFGNLELIEIEGDNLSIKGASVNTERLRFFRTAVTDLEAIWAGNMSANLELTATEKRGIIEVSKYKVK